MIRPRVHLAACLTAVEMLSDKHKQNAMDDEPLLKIKDALDKDLEGRDPRVGIAFGIELFDEFRRKDWITLEIFVGIFGFEAPMPAYKKTHHAFPNWGLPPYEYRIGKDGQRT